MPSHTSERLAALVPVVEFRQLQARPASVAAYDAWRLRAPALPAAPARRGGSPALAAGLGLGIAIGLAIGLGLGVAVGVGLGIGVGIGLDVVGRVCDELF